MNRLLFIALLWLALPAFAGPTPLHLRPHLEHTLGETVYVTKTGKKYHRSGCGYLSHSKRAIELSDAKAAGYTPCSRCKPPK
jgi:hypothetical protein